jgi:hypothetical protein
MKIFVAAAAAMLSGAPWNPGVAAYDGTYRGLRRMYERRPGGLEERRAREP